jgi:Fe-S-cluster containining protein
MNTLVQIETADQRLLSSIAETMDEAVRRGGSWIACRPGCTQCCMGTFAITALDAFRLRLGLDALRTRDPLRASRIQERATAYIQRIGPHYPGNAQTGALDDEDALPESLDSLACPALDPTAGTCDLYESRPITCRTFGPVTRLAEGTYAACELCYEGASDEQMAACAVEIDPDGTEAALLKVAFALVPGVAAP